MPEAAVFLLWACFPMPHPNQDTRLTIRLTPEELAQLEAKAGDRALSAFVRDLALERAARRKTAQHQPGDVTTALAQVLALLGRSGALTSLAAIGTAAQNGVLELDEVTLARLNTGLDDLAMIKRLLMKALRVAER